MPHHIDPEQPITRSNERPGLVRLRGLVENFLSLWRYTQRVFAREGLAENRSDSGAREKVGLALGSGDPELREADSPHPAQASPQPFDRVSSEVQDIEERDALQPEPGGQTGPEELAIDSFATSSPETDAEPSTSPVTRGASESPQIGESLPVRDSGAEESRVEPDRPTAAGEVGSTARLALSDQLDSLRGRLETIERFLIKPIPSGSAENGGTESSSIADGFATYGSTANGSTASGSALTTPTIPSVTGSGDRRPAVFAGETAIDSTRFDSSSLDSSGLGSSDFDSLTERAAERALFDRGFTLE